MTPKRVDANQAAVVKKLRAMGASVLHLHELGQGAPDILVGYGKRNFLIEIKDPNQPPSKRKLTRDEELFHQTWTGQVDVATSFEEIIYKMGIK